MQDTHQDILSRWRTQAESEWFHPESSEVDLQSQILDMEPIRSTSATPRGVEESWIDLKEDKKTRNVNRAVHVLDEDAFERDDEESEDGEENDFPGTRKARRFCLKDKNTPVKTTFDLNTSLTTILATPRKYYDEDLDDQDLPHGPNIKTDESQVVFMDLSNASSVVSSTQLSLKRNKKRKIKPGSGKGQSELAQSFVIISIIASLSFSAGYALGQSRRHLY